MAGPRNKTSIVIALVLTVIALAVGVVVIVIGGRAPAPDMTVTTVAPPRPPLEPAPSAPSSAPTPAAPAQPPPHPQPIDERDAMDQIRARAHDDPDGALALIEVAEQAHPQSPFAEERAALRVDALVFARRIGVARDAAEEFLRRYPRGPRAQHIEMLTGVHPRPPEPED
jgi:hypothetical protein